MFVTSPEFIGNVNDSLPTRTIIEVDGVNHQPYTVDQIQIFAGKCRLAVPTNTDVRQGQRYSFVVSSPIHPHFQAFTSNIHPARRQPRSR